MGGTREFMKQWDFVELPLGYLQKEEYSERIFLVKQSVDQVRPLHQYYLLSNIEFYIGFCVYKFVSEDEVVYVEVSSESYSLSEFEIIFHPKDYKVLMGYNSFIWAQNQADDISIDLPTFQRYLNLLFTHLQD